MCVYVYTYPHTGHKNPFVCSCMWNEKLRLTNGRSVNLRENINSLFYIHISPQRLKSIGQQ
jgi:hypothetical protein